MRMLRLLGLLEDGAVKLSMTGVSMWVTTLQNVHAISFGSDKVTMAFSAASNFGAGAMHILKRWGAWHGDKE